MKQIALRIWVKDKLCLEEIKELNTLGQFIFLEKSRLKRYQYWKKAFSIMVIKKRIYPWDIILHHKKVTKHFFPDGAGTVDVTNAEESNEKIDSVCRFIGARIGKLTGEVAREIDSDESTKYIYELIKIEIKNWITMFNLHKNEKQFIKDMKKELALLNKKKEPQKIEDKTKPEIEKKSNVFTLLAGTRNAADGEGCL